MPTHLWVSYSVDEEFVIPQGINLDDTSKVKSYEVKHSVLTITFVDGTSLQLQSKGMNYHLDEPTGYHPDEIDTDDEEEDTCECCESGLPAKKVNGVLVCVKCDNFVCQMCGIDFNESHVEWDENKQLCLCETCITPKSDACK